MYDLFRAAESVPELALLAKQPDQPGRLEQSGEKMPRHQSRQALQLRGNRTNQKEQEVVAGSQVNKRLLERVAEVYEWLNQQICSGGDLAGKCRSCSSCCDFDHFDHRLFVTPPELMYLAANLCAGNIKPMPDGRCPYNVEGRCSVYEYRFLACRIFCCNGDADFQSRLSEEALAKFKSICTEFQIPYRYTDLPTALSNFASVWQSVRCNMSDCHSALDVESIDFDSGFPLSRE